MKFVLDLHRPSFLKLTAFTVKSANKIFSSLIYKSAKMNSLAAIPKQLPQMTTNNFK